MRISIAPVVLAVVLAAGCAARVGVHTWSDSETPYYNDWIVETHHSHVDYNHLNRHDQKAYWHWRDQHHDDHH